MANRMLDRGKRVGNLAKKIIKKTSDRNPTNFNHVESVTSIVAIE